MFNKKERPRKNAKNSCFTKNFYEFGCKGSMKKRKKIGWVSLPNLPSQIGKKTTNKIVEQSK